MAGVSIPTLLMLCGWTLLGLALAAGTAGAADADDQATPLPTQDPLSPMDPLPSTPTQDPLSPMDPLPPRKGLRKAVQQLQSSLLALQEAFKQRFPDGNSTSGSGSGGATYIRWGRTSCPAGSDLVYKGFAGGTYFTHSGAAVDYLCLPEQPQWAKYNDKFELIGGSVHGAEYQTNNRIPNFNNHNQDVPCAVCRSPTRSSALMIPARTSCHPGFHREYQGYLMAGLDANKAASQYVCVDQQPESVPGGEANKDGKLFYFVESRCGSLKCPPYVNGRELTCVVCSK